MSFENPTWLEKVAFRVEWSLVTIVCERQADEIDIAVDRASVRINRCARLRIRAFVFIVWYAVAVIVGG